MKNKLAHLLFLVLAVALISGCKPTSQKDKQGIGTTKEFKGDIKLDVRESKPDWEPYIRKKAPEGAPNILFIL
jgi:hypothetical protein